MTKVSELVSQNVGNQIINSQTWASLIYNVKNPAYAAKGDGTTNDTVGIAAAITAATATGGIVMFPPGTYITANQTVPANVTLWFANGAKLSINTGAIVTINGFIDAGLYPIFTGLGVVSGIALNPEYYPEWFGAVGDRTNDDTTAVQKCLDFAYTGTIKLKTARLSRDYMVSSTINQPQGVSINGYGGTLKAKDTTLNPVLRVYNKNAPTAPFNPLFNVFGLTIEGDTIANRGVQLGVSIDTNYQGGLLSTFRDCEIKYFLTGVKLNNGNRMIVFDNCKITTKNFGIQIVSTGGTFTGDHWIKACQIECETGTCIDLVCNGTGSQLMGIHINGGCVLYCLIGVSAVTDATSAAIVDLFINDIAFDGRGTNSMVYLNGGANSGKVLISNLWLNASDYGIYVTGMQGVLINNSKFSSVNYHAVAFNNANHCSITDSVFHDCNKLQNGGGVINLLGTTTKSKVRGNAIFNSVALANIPIVVGASTVKCTVTDNSTDTTNVLLNNGTGTVFANNVGA